jgi:hypothetical protein
VHAEVEVDVKEWESTSAFAAAAFVHLTFLLLMNALARAPKYP